MSVFSHAYVVLDCYASRSASRSASRFYYASFKVFYQQSITSPFASRHISFFLFFAFGVKTSNNIAGKTCYIVIKSLKAIIGKAYKRP